RIQKPTRINQPEILLPEQVPIEVETVESLSAKRSHDVLPICNWGRGGLAGFGVPLDFGNPFMSHPFPLNFASVFVQAVNSPGMTGNILGRFHVAVKSVAVLRLRITTDSRCEEKEVTPNDGA